ncbi:MAG: hypothetical protein ED556_05110 [Winogradskyella sp.]|uniref:peptidase G2 autoproteolytic cleavage domain-containing protein n=1 Tax=Winogradskyella sp. TaxID=1883156 RepID=UPI000F3C9FCF|nr:peptidase G2 autoproteolytic cleavage domain-containing protein [Winogradskyella sp.]RNC86804.1 MAG: hypothetical protein ED556_05110 [Winogradskyella sp.]
MKKILLLAFLFCLHTQLFAQTDGITYQAVIIGPEDLELPGVDSAGNYLPNATIAIRFTILNEVNQIEFQEIQVAETDDFGRINLLIGDANNDEFKEISWDGTPKDLKVEIDFEAGSDFEELSRERLTFLPFAFHRNITATGTLTVDDRTFLNGELQVEGQTNLNDALNVNEQVPTYLSGTLTVDGATSLNGSLDVNNGSDTNLTGILNVDGNTTLNSDLDVLNGNTTLNTLSVLGQANFGVLNTTDLTVTNTTNLNGLSLSVDTSELIRLRRNFIQAGLSNESDPQAISDHAVVIEGGRQGLAIKVNGERSNNTNFITFFDDESTVPWGRIEGELPSEFANNADYVFDQSSLDFDIYDSEVDAGFALAYEVIAAAQLIKASSDFRACVGLGGCLASPGPADIAFAGVELISAAAQVIFAALVLDRSYDNKAIYDNNKLTFQGVTYASGAGDYAEYLQREDLNEKMTFGDIVGLKGGKISKNINGAERVMVVSYKPIVLGNMPQVGHEDEYEKVAFMGQVPVKVYGKVNIGDYIIPSGVNDGTGIAISPKDITLKQIKNIVGVAWSTSNEAYKKSMINVAVGLNKNDNNPLIEKLEDKIKVQSQEIAELKSQILEIYDVINAFKNGDSPKGNFGNDSDGELVINNYHNRNYEVAHAEHGDIVYWEVTREDIEKAFEMAWEQMRLNGVDVENNYFWKRIKNEPAYKDALIQKLQSKLDKQLHYHKSVFKQD